MDALARLEIEHEVWLEDPGDGFQRRARLLQAIWREERGYPIGRYTPPGRDERTMGSLLEKHWAKESLANFLTPAIREIVYSEVLGTDRDPSKVYGEPRIFYNLLSSQPLCFNLMAELQPDLRLATEVFRDLMGDVVRRVTRIDFEHSPGRWSPRYTNDGSAFDVFVEFVTREGGQGFVGIEAKYHESLKRSAERDNPLLIQRAGEMGCFVPERVEHLRTSALRQIWRDHLLAGSMRMADGYETGTFVLLRPRHNGIWDAAAREYRACLNNQETFSEWILEDVVELLRNHSDAEWLELFHDRYLAFEKVDTELARLGLCNA